MKNLAASVLFLFLFSYAQAADNDITIADKANLTSNANYLMDVSKPVGHLSAQLIVSTDSFDGILVGTAAINGTNDTVVSTVTYPAGFAVYLTSSSLFNNWYGLGQGTTYYMIPYGSGYAKLATTKALAIAGTAFDLPVITSGTGKFTLTPINIQATSPFTGKWQASNDNSHWYNMSATSVTIQGGDAPTSYMWDFGFVSWKYTRFAVTAGDYGSITLKILGFINKFAVIMGR